MARNRVGKKPGVVTEVLLLPHIMKRRAVAKADVGQNGHNDDQCSHTARRGHAELIG